MEPAMSHNLSFDHTLCFDDKKLQFATPLRRVKSLDMSPSVLSWDTATTWAEATVGVTAAVIVHRVLLAVKNEHLYKMRDAQKMVEAKVNDAISQKMEDVQIKDVKPDSVKSEKKKPTMKMRIEKIGKAIRRLICSCFRPKEQD